MVPEAVKVYSVMLAEFQSLASPEFGLIEPRWVVPLLEKVPKQY
jgi:hypothetical protein